MPRDGERFNFVEQDDGDAVHRHLWQRLLEQLRDSLLAAPRARSW